MTDLLHRIRWANVARAVALLLVALLALAWPRLKSHDDALPPALAEPVTVAEEAGAGAAVGVGDEAALSDSVPATADAARFAARRKAAKRRAAREAAAKRAQQRRRTVARRRRAAGAAPDDAEANAGAVTGAAPSGGATAPHLPAAPPSPAAEFRP